jgi:hypothetical protein
VEWVINLLPYTGLEVAIALKLMANINKQIRE